MARAAPEHGTRRALKFLRQGAVRHASALPAEEIKGWRLTRQGKRHYAENVVERVDPRGRKYYWIGGDDMGFAKEEGTDCMAVHERYISVTPLHADMTNHGSFQEIKSFMFPWP